MRSAGADKLIVMGIKAVGHDTGAAIIADDGDNLRIYAIAEARINRIKHSWRYPLQSMQFCLHALGLRNLSEVDAIYFDWHVGQFAENLSTRTPPSEFPDCDTVTAFNQALHGLLQINVDKIKYCSHLSAHAASAYYLASYDEATALVIDGGLGIFKGEGNSIKPIDMYGYPNSMVDGRKIQVPDFWGPGPLYEHVTRQLGFSRHDAGKTMALASFGHEFEFEDCYSITKNRHDSIWIDYRPTINWIVANLPTFDVAQEEDGGSALVSKFWVNLARQSQQILEEDVIFLVKESIKKTGSRNLAYSGGVAQSCVANRKIFDTGCADEIFIPPGSSDEGIALGCALWGYYEEGGKNRKILDNAYLGRGYDPTEVSDVLKNNGLEYRETDDAEVASLISQGKIIGRIAGASEYGPRALGNRSILADPRRSEMPDVLNSRIKHREGFRPFAASVTYEKRSDYFDMPMEGSYMNIAAAVRSSSQESFPAVTHVDGSCRPQTVRQEQNPGYHSLLEAFGAETGVYCLLNTSFNDNGEPMVETFDDAARTFRRTELDYLYIENHLAWKPQGVVTDTELSLRTEAHAETYQELIDQYSDRNSLTKVIKSVTLENGKNACELCNEIGILRTE